MRQTYRFALLPLAIVLVSAFRQPAHAESRDAYTGVRLKMVEDVITSEGITNEAVITAMKTVPRHLFVRQEKRPMAYYDMALDIGHKQTISAPFIVAYMTETLDPQPDDVVLEIGTGSGYQASVLSKIVKDVYTIEIVEELSKHAQEVIKTLKYKNVHCLTGDGYKGWPEHAPFDKIIVTCSPERVPQPLIDQLKEGGKMIVPLGQRYQQVFYLFEKKDGQLVETKLVPTLFVPMTGTAEQIREVQPDPLHPQLFNGGFDIDENEDEQPDGFHYARRTKLDTQDPYAGKFCLKFENNEPGRVCHALQGFPVDGSKVPTLDVQIAHRQLNLRQGPEADEKPGVVLHFYDVKQKPVGDVTVFTWLNDQQDWSLVTKNVPVPRDAIYAIIQFGLNGGTGQFWADNLSVSPGKKSASQP